MRALAVVAFVCMAAAVAVGIARPWSGRAPTGVSAMSSLLPGGFSVVVHNDSSDAVHIAQVTVDDAFVGFRSPRLTVTPHERAQLAIDYAWVKGEPYEIDVLTSTGDIVESQAGGAEGS